MEKREEDDENFGAGDLQNQINKAASAREGLEKAQQHSVEM